MTQLTHTALVAKLADETGVARHGVAQVLKALGAAVAGAEEVAVAGLGKFNVVAVAARAGRNPRTGEDVAIPARRAVRFHPSSTLKGAVNV